MKFEQIENLEQSDILELQPEGWSDIFSSIKFYVESDFCFPIKITNNNKIIGIGSTILHEKSAWLTHIIIHKDFRKLGLGRQITEKLIESLPNHIDTTYLIATEFGLPVYEKVGFVKESEYLFYRDIDYKNSENIPENIKPFKKNNLENCFKLDKLVSNENRQVNLLEHFDKALIYQTDDEILGFYLPTFGEGLIISTDKNAGIELLKIRLRSNNKLVFPSENIIAQKFMENLGYREYKKAWRMRIGKDKPIKLEAIFSRINGSLG